jgi:hypothetical protein
MRLSERSYPHPVVGNRDDVPGAAFQAAVEMTTDKQAIYLDVTINCSSKTINDLIKKKDAQFVMHVECSNTLYRKAFEFEDAKYRLQIPIDNLNDAVEVNVFARATRAISGYRVDAAHPDYANVTFEVDKGDILAVADGNVFYLDAPFDALSPIGSIMQIQASHEAGDKPMQVQYSGPKIVIYLSKQDFADYKMLKSVSTDISIALSTTIVLPVLIKAIDQVRENDDDDLRWIRALKRRLEVLQLKIEDDSLEIAQKMLELPVKRTLASARMIAENQA